MVQGEIFPVSARRAEGVKQVVSALTEALPEGPFLYAPEAGPGL